MNIIDKANLVDVKSDTVKQAYIKGAEKNGFEHGKLGLKLPTKYPEDTLLEMLTEQVTRVESLYSKVTYR